VAVALAATACSDHLEDRALCRMIVQERYATWQACPDLEGGSIMRPPPEGVVARESSSAPEPVRTGLDRGVYVDRVPVPVTEGVVRRGADRFAIFCAPCHGGAGDGESFVARRMDLRRPPSLVGEGASRLPPGRLFQVATVGYGLMPGQARALDVDDRWAVVAFVMALQRRARGVRLDDLSPAERGAALEQLR
jgi:mono/diheme cytochrome c family protein